MIKTEPKPRRTKATAEAESGEPTIAAPRDCKMCPRWREVRRQMGIASILKKAVKKFENKLEDERFQPTVAEYLKLVQIEQEYEKELNPPEEIRVTWVEPKSESEISK